MSVSFEITAPGLPDFTTGIENVPVAIRRNLLDAANQAAVYGVSVARQHVPVWQGVLRDDIHATPAILSADGIAVSVATDLPYAATMEEGRRPGAPMPPQGALLAWMASKGIPAELEFVVRRGIAVHGIPGHFFMKAAYDALNAGIVDQLFSAALDKALAGFGSAA